MIPPGTIAVLHQGAIHPDLTTWLEQLRERHSGHLLVLKPQGNQIPRQRNLAVEHLWGEWLLFVDSDTIPPPHALEDLLECGEALVGGVVLERFTPFWIAAVKSLDPPVKWSVKELPSTGLLPAEGLGCGCLLIRRSVFERVEPPWFRCGQIVPDLLLEDVEFSFRAKTLGIQPYLHCGVRVGHAVRGVLWPGRDGQPWVQWPGPVEMREPVASEHVGVEERRPA